MRSHHLFAAACVVLISGCSTIDPGDPMIDARDLMGVPVSESTPGFASPPEVLRRVEWAFNHQSLPEYADVLAADFQFVFSALDTNGNAYQTEPWTREDELVSTAKLFAESAQIDLMFDRTVAVFADVRPGKSPEVHKVINSTVNLQITFDDGSRTEIRGRAKFYFVRGDSAIIPDELIERGVGPDANRWFIDRWEDDTAGEGLSARPMPASKTSWGALRVRFR